MDTSVKFVTVDTNLYQDEEILEIGAGLPYIHLYSTEVSESEVGKKVTMGFQTRTDFPWGTRPWGHIEIIKNKAIPSVITVGRYRIGSPDTIPKDGLGDDLIKSILNIATNGSFRYPQDSGSDLKGKMNQLNDALILQAHCNRGHHILLSNDTKFFGKNDKDQKRLALEAACKTKIMSGAEFKAEYQPHLSKYQRGNT